MAALSLGQLYLQESENQTDTSEKPALDTKSQREIPGRYILDRLPGIAPKVHLREDRGATYETVQDIQHSTLPVAVKAPSRDYFISLQEWEGAVVQISTDSFLARLVDLTQQNPDEEADFLLDDVSDEDRKLVAPGAVFYWCIGYRVRKGQRSRTSEIRFRRLPAWTEREVEESKHKAAELQRAIIWE